MRTTCCYHLEEIDYLQEVGVQQGQQGCILFLDFEKAYDRLDRDWLRRCMETMCFPESSMRWVRLLLAGHDGPHCVQRRSQQQGV